MRSEGYGTCPVSVSVSQSVSLSVTTFSTTARTKNQVNSDMIGFNATLG